MLEVKASGKGNFKFKKLILVCLQSSILASIDSYRCL